MSRPLSSRRATDLRTPRPIYRAPTLSAGDCHKRDRRCHWANQNQPHAGEIGADGASGIGSGQPAGRRPVRARGSRWGFQHADRKRDLLPVLVRILECFLLLRICIWVHGVGHHSPSAVQSNQSVLGARASNRSGGRAATAKAAIVGAPCGRCHQCFADRRKPDAREHQYAIGT